MKKTEDIQKNKRYGKKKSFKAGSVEKNGKAGSAKNNFKAGSAEKNGKAGSAKNNFKAEKVKKSPETEIANGKDFCKESLKCGGCEYRGIPYEEQLQKKQKFVEDCLGRYGKTEPILGMDNPYYYRNKVHHVFHRDRQGNIISGFYEEASHHVIGVRECMLEDRKSQEVIATIQSLLKSFRITVYNETSEYGLLRHVLVRRGFATGEIMVVLVCTSPVFPSKNNFVKALRKVHPEITTVVLNINDKYTSMVLGERNITIYGPGFIKDKLQGSIFRISPGSFYQINPLQTEKLYQTAVDYAQLSGRETVIDAYCGIGTIGITAASKAGKVIGIELNKEAVKDALINCKENKITNASFYHGDAGEFMMKMAARGEKAEVIFMDPPRSGSTKQFMDAAAMAAPERIVYISCNPVTQADDLKYLTKKGYAVRKIQPVDMFPFSGHVETVVLLTCIK